MTSRAALPRLDDLPIPADVRPGAGWTGQMLELAAHIGAHATLEIVAAFGGERVSVPRDPARSPFADVIDSAAAAKVAWVYGGSRFEVPVAAAAVRRARRAGVLASVRAKKLAAGDAAKILGTSRTYLLHLLNSDEGTLAAPLLAKLLTPPDPRQLDMFAEE